MAIRITEDDGSERLHFAAVSPNLGPEECAKGRIGCIYILLAQ